jgi:ABC-type glutathione transport system ATPase component
LTEWDPEPVTSRGVYLGAWQRRTGIEPASDVSFEVGCGEVFVVMGLSGSGKSPRSCKKDRLKRAAEVTELVGLAGWENTLASVDV